MKETTNTNIKTGIKLRVNPEQSKKIQEICFANNISWIDGTKDIFLTDKPFLYIKKNNSLSWDDTEIYFYNQHLEEIDTELFIRTNGTCIEPLESSNQPKPKEYLVYVEGQKAPKVIHTDIDSAKEEAKRLAKKMTSLRKQTFKVYVVEVKAKFQSEIIVNEID